MSNYHVEPADRPQALSSEAIKSLRTHQVKGISRRQLLRYSLGGAMAVWSVELLAGTIGFLWPNLSGGFGGKVRIGTLEEIKLLNSSLPIAEGFPGLLPRGAGVHRPDRSRPTAVRSRRGHRAAMARRSTSGRSTSAVRTSAASRTRASRISGWSARATARATTVSGSRLPAPSTDRRPEAWTASRRRWTAMAS